MIASNSEGPAAADAFAKGTLARDGKICAAVGTVGERVANSQEEIAIGAYTGECVAEATEEEETEKLAE